MRAENTYHHRGRPARLLTGLAYPKMLTDEQSAAAGDVISGGSVQSYDEFYHDPAVRLSRADVEGQMRGKPICLEHDTGRVVGHITDKWVRGSALRINAAIYRDAVDKDGANVCDRVDSGDLTGLSIQYGLDRRGMQIKSKTVLEVSLCKEPFFDGAYVDMIAASKTRGYNTSGGRDHIQSKQPEEIFLRFSSTAMNTDNAPTPPTSDAAPAAAAAAPAADPPQAAEPGQGQGQGELAARSEVLIEMENRRIATEGHLATIASLETERALAADDMAELAAYRAEREKQAEAAAAERMKEYETYRKDYAAVAEARGDDADNIKGWLDGMAPVFASEAPAAATMAKQAMVTVAASRKTAEEIAALKGTVAKNKAEIEAASNHMNHSERREVANSKFGRAAADADAAAADNVVAHGKRNREAAGTVDLWNFEPSEHERRCFYEKYSGTGVTLQNVMKKRKTAVAASANGETRYRPSASPSVFGNRKMASMKTMAPGHYDFLAGPKDASIAYDPEGCITVNSIKWGFN